MMNVEVFKLYDSDGVRQFDAINPSYAKWLFNSINRRDYENDGSVTPSPFVNNERKDAQADSTIYFDGGSSINYQLESSIKNIVIKTDKPKVNADTTTYVSFNEKSGSHPIDIQIFLLDKVGIDNEIIRIGLGNTCVYEIKRINENEVQEVVEDGYDDVFSRIRIARGTTATPQYELNFRIDVSALCTEIPDGEVEELNDLWFEVFDIAGNCLHFEGFKKFISIPMTFDEFLKGLKRLELDFVDTHPANFFIENNMIGYTYAVVDNPNLDYSKYGLYIKLGLMNDSLGYLDPYDKISINDDTENTMKQKIDGIDSTGFVHAYAHLWNDDWPTNILNSIKTVTEVEGELGKFVTECEDNKRKLFLDPFIPKCIKSEMMNDFLKFVENYFNTMFMPMEKDCRIGLLEKIERIGQFKDIDAVEYPLVGNFGREYGSELDFDLDGMKSLANIAEKYSTYKQKPKSSNNTTRAADDGLEETAPCALNEYDLVRKLYRTLPYIDKYKGTINCFNVLFNCIGLHTQLIPLWEHVNGETSSFVPEDQADDSYHLSSHIKLVCNGYFAKDLLSVAEVLIRLAQSVLPIIRVIEELEILEISKSTNSLVLINRHGDVTNACSRASSDAISLIYQKNEIKRSTNGWDLEIPVFPSKGTRVPVSGTKWIGGQTTSSGHDRGKFGKDESIHTYPTNNTWNFWQCFDRCHADYDKPLIMTYVSSPDKSELEKQTGRSQNISVKITDMQVSGNKVLLKLDEFTKDSAMKETAAYNYTIITFYFNRAVNNFCYPVPYSVFFKLDTLTKDP